MTKLIIDPRGGIAGDMFAAALISAGANEIEMINAMQLAANSIGDSEIKTQTTEDGSCRLLMHIHHNHGHLGASKARNILIDLITQLQIEEPYSLFAKDVLEILISAEKQAHEENSFLTDKHHSHNHGHHDHPLEHEHHHHHEHEEEAWLHEAQDIIIDIIGAAYGLQLLNAPTIGLLLHPISLGGGRIKFSHGEMDVPAPATKIITDKYNIQTITGPIDIELCTPTGSAILAALKVTQAKENDMTGEALHIGKSRGGKDLDIPPFGIYITK